MIHVYVISIRIYSKPLKYALDIHIVHDCICYNT
jgi:hypothetical protein